MSNNKNKLIKLSFFVLLISLISISAVSADDTFIDEISENNENDFEIRGAVTGNTFSDLQQEIDSNTDPNDIIELTQNITNTGTESQITISKSLTIDGKGFTIDAAGVSRIFEISAGSVTLKNLKLINGKEYGGAAIDILNSNVHLLNITFENNIADHSSLTDANGGAIKIKSSTIIIEDCSFYKNAAKREGGAIYATDSNVTINGSSIFDENYAGFSIDDTRANGGAIRVVNSNELFNISGKGNFTNNKAYHGGAIYIEIMNFEINGNFLFENNTAAGNGGGLNIGLTIGSKMSFLKDNLHFISNSAGSSGGAIYSNYGDNLCIEGNNKFDKNTASQGGAIASNTLTTIILGNNSFYNNFATNYGGAVYLLSSSSTQMDYNTISGNNKFINNTAKYGGAVYSNIIALKILDNNTFENNSAYHGGAIYYPFNNLELQGSNSFINNIAISTDDSLSYGGAIFLRGNDINIVNDGDKYNSFINNSADDGGAIYLTNSKNFNSIKSVFEDNLAYNSGGALSIENSENIYFEGNNIINNTAISLGGAIYTINSNKLDFKNNTINYNKGEDGGALYLFFSNDIQFLNNYMGYNKAIGTEISGYGGAIYIFRTYDIDFIDKNIIVNNSANRDGGGIYVGISKNLIIQNYNQFLNNTASASGGAIYSQVLINLNITGNNTFYFNEALGYGGAIYSDGGELIGIYGENIFASNHAGRSGGAIYNSIDDLTIHGENVFEYNHAELNGGALYNDGDNFVIEKNNSFSFNYANQSGGVLYNLEGNTYSINGTNSFINNTAYKEGGVIYNAGSYFNITGSNIFINNSAVKFRGGVLYNTGDSFYIMGSNQFIGNQALNEYGGVLYNHGSDWFRIQGNNLFENNSAAYGGAIQNEYGFHFLINGENIFRNNSAIYQGGTIYNDDGESFIIMGNNSFEYNTAEEAGVIFNYGSAYFFIYGFNNFQYNEATGVGGVIYNLGGNDFTIMGNNEFTFNGGEITGGVIYNSGDRFEIHGNNIISNNFVDGEGGVIYTSLDDGFWINGTNIFENNIATTYGGVIYAYDPSNFLISGNNRFFNNSGMHGAVVYVDVGENFTIYGANEFIKNNASSEGGVISSYELFDLVVEGSNIFEENYAPLGGVFYNEFSGSVYINETNEFKQNLADNGAVFYISGIEEFYIEGSNIFSNNNANLYGGVIYNTESYLEIEGNYFINNSASLGNLLYNYFSSEASLIDTNSYSGDIEGFFIYNVGTLFLENNIMDSTEIKKIYNTGTITSEIIFEVLDNETKYPNYLDHFNMTGTLTDDVGNIIVGGTVTFFTGIRYLSTSDYSDEGIFFTIIELFTAGIFNVTGSYSGGDNLTVFIGIVEIERINVILNVTANPDVILYGDFIILDIFLSDAYNNILTCMLNITVTGDNGYYMKYVNVDIVGGNLQFTLSDLRPGIYTVEVYHALENNYYNATSYTTFIVKKLTPIISVYPIHGIENKNIVLNYVTDSRINSIFSILITDYMISTINVNDGYGSLYLNNLASGVYNVTAYYQGNDIFEGTSVSFLFTINKTNTNLIIAPIVDANGDVIVQVQTTSGATGIVTVEIDGIVKNITLNDGSGIVVYSGLKNGNYNITAYYYGDEYFNSSSASANITVANKDVILKAPSINLIYLDGSKFLVYLYDAFNNPIANANISITINTRTYYRITDSKGIASLTINLAPGEYHVDVGYVGNGTYVNQNTTSSVTVKSTIIGKDVVKYYKNGTQFVARYVDSNGNPLSNQVVTFNINGIFYSRTTDINGYATLNINLIPGYYILTTTNPNDGLARSYSVEVLSNIEISDLTKYYLNDSQFHAKFYDNQGNPYANKNVTFNINGVFYMRTTNSDGIATLNINLAPGQYIISAIIPLNGYVTSSRVIVLPTLLANNTVISNSNKVPYVILVLDGQGNPYPNQKVVINLNGQIYERTTESDGKIRLDINLNPGSYYATMTYNDYSLSTTIVVTS
ncbi:right-handed parallel beta-helix repeat-containing protein [Methanobrevibacter sp. DSM 116169]|uniref:right-handed parallel beta-helix repeat-containing protein n=1 Tax=Methanobrevibacter sp. DSM 116169 TaxID=3242727 RepID=UPI0038FC16F8